MTTAVVIAAGDADHYTSTEQAAARALSDGSAKHGLAGLPCGTFSRLIALSVAAAATVGAATDAVAYGATVYPIGSGHDWYHPGDDGTRLSTILWARIDDPAGFTGGALDLRNDDGTTFSTSADAGTIVIANATRVWRVGGVTPPGTCRLVQIVGLRPGCNPGPSTPNQPGDGYVCW